MKIRNHQATDRNAGPVLDTTVSAVCGPAPALPRWRNTPGRATANAEGVCRDIVAIGASAGGVAALCRLFSALPLGYSGVVAAVLHRSRLVDGELAALLCRYTSHPIIEPHDAEVLERGRIYVAPRDRHMTFQDGRLRLDCGPRRHYTRPAIDPLFQSAAAAYGVRVVGVLLTGAGHDGLDGLIAIKAAGGLSLAQDPTEARHPSMPLAAIRSHHVDLVLRVADIAGILVSLADGEVVTGLNAGAW